MKLNQINQIKQKELKDKLKLVITSDRTEIRRNQIDHPISSPQAKRRKIHYF